MSENSPENDTGLVPPVSGNNANFENVEVGTGETVATAEEAVPLATAEGSPVSSNSSSNSSSNTSSNSSDASPNMPVEEEVSAAPKTYTSKTGKPMSQSQYTEQALRAETFKDMQAKYAERFGDKNMYKKAPKAKIYNAGRLSKVRRDEGEDAYMAELNKVMDRDDPMIAKNASLNTRKVKKSVAPSMNKGLNSMAFAPPTPSVANNSARNAGSKKVMLDAFDEMAQTVKGIIDTMSKTAKTLAGELAKTNSSAMPQMSSMLANSTRKAPKKRASRAKTMRSNSGLVAPLPPFPEETSSNLLNANNGGR